MLAAVAYGQDNYTCLEEWSGIHGKGKIKSKDNNATDQINLIGIFILLNSNLYLSMWPREGPKKKLFLGNISQIWVGEVADSQTSSKNPKKITPKIAFFYPNFTFCVSKSVKNPGVGG